MTRLLAAPGCMPGKPPEKPPRSDQLDELLAEVLAFQQTDERLGRGIESLRDGLAVLQLLLRDQRAELLERLGPHVQMFGDDEALHEQPLREYQRRMLERYRLTVIAGDITAQRDAAERVHARHRHVEHFAADVLETAVHAVGRCGLQVLIQIAGLVVDARVEAERL